jgi:hypothetical protein
MRGCSWERGAGGWTVAGMAACWSGGIEHMRDGGRAADCKGSCSLLEDCRACSGVTSRNLSVPPMLPLVLAPSCPAPPCPAACLRAETKASSGSMKPDPIPFDTVIIRAKKL